MTEYVTPKWIADQWDCGLNHVYQLLQSGQIKSVKPDGSRKYIIRRTWVDEYVDNLYRNQSST